MLGESKGEQKKQRTKHNNIGSEPLPKPLRTRTSYANAATGTLGAPQPLINSAALETSFLLTHCLVPLHVEHKMQPRRKRKVRSFRAYRACPQHTTKSDMHTSCAKKEALVRHNSLVEPPSEPPTEAQLFKRLFPMASLIKWPSFLAPLPLDALLARSCPKPPKVRPDCSKARKIVNPGPKK